MQIEGGLLLGGEAGAQIDGAVGDVAASAGGGGKVGPAAAAAFESIAPVTVDEVSRARDG